MTCTPKRKSYEVYHDYHKCSSKPNWLLKHYYTGRYPPRSESPIKTDVFFSTIPSTHDEMQVFDKNSVLAKSERKLLKVFLLKKPKCKFLLFLVIAIYKRTLYLSTP
jgi:hypothetical protein